MELLDMLYGLRHFTDVFKCIQNFKLLFHKLIINTSILTALVVRALPGRMGNVTKTSSSAAQLNFGQRCCSVC